MHALHQLFENSHANSSLPASPRRLVKTEQAIQQLKAEFDELREVELLRRQEVCLCLAPHSYFNL
jgi:hypothetical protein